MPFDISLPRVAENSRSLLKPKKQWKIQHNILDSCGFGAIGRNIFPNVAQMRLKREHVDVLFHFCTRPLPFRRDIFSLMHHLFADFFPTFSSFHAAALLQSGMNKREKKSSEIKWKEHGIFFLLANIHGSDYTRKVMRNIFRSTPFHFRFEARWD